MSYPATNGVLVLSGSLGGPASWGTDQTSALNSPSLSGTWHNDYSQPILLSGSGSEAVPTIAIPQVLVSFAAPVDSPSMHGYDNGWQVPLGTGSSNGKFVVAYNGVPQDGYIFNFVFNSGDVTPFYRYQAGQGPLALDTTNGWPPSNVSIFPAQLHYNGDTLSVDSFTEGFVFPEGSGGYWSHVYYKGLRQGVNVYGEMHEYIAGSGSTGQMWGMVEDASVAAQWNPTTRMFVADSTSGVALTSSTTAPTYGPPNLELNGVLLWFMYSDVQGSDVYISKQGQAWGVVNSSYSVTASDGNSTVTGSYDPSSQVVSAPEDLSAVSADGTTLLGDDGLVVLTTGWTPSLKVAYHSDPSNEFYLRSLYRPDGTAVFKYCRCYYGYFAFDGSPIYQNLTLIDARNGWPASNVSSDSLPPQSLPGQGYIDGVLVTMDYCSGTYVAAYYGTTTLAIGFHYSGIDKSVSVHNHTESFFGTAPGWQTWDGIGDAPSNWWTGCNPEDVSFSLDIAFSTCPQNGPAQVSWNGTRAYFSYNSNGTDVYQTSADGGVLDFSIAIDTSRNVTVAGTQPTAYSYTGTYNAVTSRFSLNGGTLLAQDAAGNLLGTPSGLIITSSAQQTWCVQLLDGSLGYSDGSRCDWTGTIYNFQRNDGSFGVKFLGIPQGSLFTIGDSPIYRYTEGSGDFVLGTGSTGTWPASNLFPQQLYVNGHYAALDASSQTTSPMHAAYHVQPTGEPIAITWTWPNASASVTGTYGACGIFCGTWDGNLFGSLPNGLVITANPPSTIARFGPPQIKWNGIELMFDPLASAVSVNNPQGVDVYRDTMGLGLSARIGSNGDVTLYQADGNQLVGNYNPNTYQFTFSGGSAGTVQADSTQGFVLHSSSGRGSGDGQGASTATMEALGNFDVQGNVFSFGNWMYSGTSTPGMMLTFTSGTSNQPSMLLFSAFRKSTDWMWCHTDTDGGTTQSTMMKLDASNRLKLFDPATQTSGTTAQPTIVLDPAVSGTSQFRGAVLIQPQGDLSMGDFTDGAKPQ